MTHIRITDLSPAGSELFQDAESFLNELTDGEFESISIRGGEHPFEFGFLLRVLHGLTAASHVKLSAHTIQTAFSNSVHNNTIHSIDGNTINGQTVSGLTISNIVTFP